jgi:hypothetical protein
LDKCIEKVDRFHQESYNKLTTESVDENPDTSASHNSHTEELGRPLADSKPIDDNTEPNCQSISKTSICSPYQDMYIDTTKLSKVYGVDKMDVEMWETIVKETTSGGSNQELLWKNWAQCPNYSGEKMQYFKSYVCLTDIFHYSSKCNQNSKAVPLCSTVCTQYHEAASSLVNNEAYCPIETTFSQETIDEIKRRRTSVNNLKSYCLTLSQSDMFDASLTCIQGVEKDDSSCGFSGDYKIANEYCKKNSDPCCQKILQHEQIFDPINHVALVFGPRFAKAVSLSSATSEIPFKLSGAMLALIIVCAVCVLAISIKLAFVIRNFMRKDDDVSGMKRLSKRKSVNEKTGAAPLIPSSSIVDGKPKLSQLKAGDKIAVKWDYKKQAADEIDLNVGDILEYIAPQDENWAEVKVIYI